jgi:predicted ATPase
MRLPSIAASCVKRSPGMTVWRWTRRAMPSSSRSRRRPAPSRRRARRTRNSGCLRIGLHTGTPLLTEEGYIGADVHRAARIAAAGHGGQVLVSAAAAALVEGWRLRDLGEHRLKDLSALERIFQLGDGEFPPLKTLYRTNLPVPATPFLGRTDELATVRELLEQADVRLLTLSGAGGSGKTRLALQAAGEMAEHYPKGVWWAPLAPLVDAAEVAPAAARALGGGGTLAEIIDGRRLLLFLDNFEHVVAAAPEVAELLAACPHADVLVTSRERLRVQGEHVYSVPVLARPEARTLFLTRARATRPDFEPDRGLDELCARLDDLPLALELAAARTSLMTTEQLLDRLGARLDLRGGRDAEKRQQTLRATIEWSYELLEPVERRLLAALSVFRGGWTLEAAERVCEADLELLESLADKSLIRRWESGRFGMLETIREFVAELLQPEEREALVRRLLGHLLELFEGANLTPHTSGEPAMELALAERPNVDVALAWVAEPNEVRAGLRLLELLEMYWGTNDPLGGRERLNSLLALAGDELEPQTLAKALRFRGATFDMENRNELSEPDYLRAIELFRSVGDEAEATHLSVRIAYAAVRLGDLERAHELASEAVEGDPPTALGVLAEVAFARGDAHEGARLAREAADAAKAVGRRWWEGVTLVGAAESLLALGEVAKARQFFADGLEMLRTVGDLVNLPVALCTGAALAAQLDDPIRAGTLWGAAEAEAEREPRQTTIDSLAHYEAYLDPVRSDTFEEARRSGRTLSREDAVAYALAPKT